MAGPHRTLALSGVTVWRPGSHGRQVLLDDITWAAQAGERWAVLGPNGAGKTTLLNLLGAVTHPSTGTVDVLGHRLGRVSTAALRRDVGFVDPGLERSLSPRLTAEQVVLTGQTSTVLLLEDEIVPADRLRARDLLTRLGCMSLVDRGFDRCSSGERKRILLARALMRDPRLLILDEPAAGLDLGGRELLIESLDALARSHPELTTVLVTHHLEELPRSTTHALLLAAGTIVAAGPIGETVTDEAMRRCFGVAVTVHSRAGRLTANA
jgi:iron complex transport system ATP-binding protein